MVVGGWWGRRGLETAPERRVRDVRAVPVRRGASLYWARDESMVPRLRSCVPFPASCLPFQTPTERTAALATSRALTRRQ